MWFYFHLVLYKILKCEVFQKEIDCKHERRGYQPNCFECCIQRSGQERRAGRDEGLRQRGGSSDRDREPSVSTGAGGSFEHNRKQDFDIRDQVINNKNEVFLFDWRYATMVDGWKTFVDNWWV